MICVACSAVLPHAFENVVVASNVYARKYSCIHKDIKSRLSSEDSCCHSFQKLWLSCLCKNIKRVTCKETVCCYIWVWNSGSLSVYGKNTVFQKKEQKEIFGNKKEVRVGWRKLHN